MGAVDITADGKRRVVVVANDAGIVHAIGRVLRQTAGFSLVGYVGGRPGVAALVAGAQPDVVVVDDLGAPAQAVLRIKEVRAAVPDSGRGRFRLLWHYAKGGPQRHDRKTIGRSSTKWSHLREVSRPATGREWCL